MCRIRALVLVLLVTYNKFICDTPNTEGKRVLLNDNIIINIIISYVVFLIYIFFLLKITLSMDNSVIRYISVYIRCISVYIIDISIERVLQG